MEENAFIQGAITTLSKEYPKLAPKLKEYTYTIDYSKRIKNYNGYIYMRYNNIRFSLSHSWIDVDKDITYGLMHTLLTKMLKLKIKSSNNIDLYNSFIKNISITTKKTKIDPLLEMQFEIINREFFLGLLEKPNLILKRMRRGKFGYYNYLNDTLAINSKLLKNPELLRYVLYHEMLHKHLKFNNSGIKNFYHTKEFKQWERKYPNYEQYEEMLKKIN